MMEAYAIQLMELQPALLNFARKLCDKIGGAEDLYAETICKALESISHFDSCKSSFKNYCYAIMINTFRTEYNHKKLWIGFIKWYNPATSYSPEGITYDYSFLRSHCRRDEVLMFADGFTLQEIAEKLNLPIGTVKRRIFDERRRLKELLNANAFTSPAKKKKTGRPLTVISRSYL